MTWKRALFAIVVLVGILHASEASAQSCTISATSVNFGNYNVFNASNTDSTGTVTYRCNAAANNITIYLSTGASGSFALREMSKGAEVLGYNLYTDAGRSAVWGNGTSGTSVYFRANPPNNQNVNVTVYGRVPAGQDVSAGTFSDTVTAVINF